jgi:hypothetical protein
MLGPSTRQEREQVHGTLSGILESWAPDLQEARPARAATEGQEEKASEDEVEKTSAARTMDFSRTARGAGRGGPGHSPHSPNQLAEGLFPWNDIWKDRHAARKTR